MTKITIYGGVKEVGGNQILVESIKSRILLDFGTRMGYEGDFFAEFLDTRTNTALKDRLTIGALPKIPGIYWENLIRPNGVEELTNERYRKILTVGSPYLEMADLETFEAYYQRTGAPFIDALFVSHAHMDHVGAIEYLHPSIPLFCSEDTKIFLETIDQVISSGFKINALTSSSRTIVYNKEKAMFPDSPKIESEPIQREYKILKDGNTVIIKDIIIKLIEVDHSIPGAASYVIEDGPNKILYTGDFRFHGTRPLTPEDYIKKVGTGINVMVCEGTRINTEKRLTEAEIGEKIFNQMKTTKGLVFVDFSWKDTTRYETVRDAARKANRTFIINARLALILHRLGICPSKDNVKVFLKRKGSALYSPADYSKGLHEYGLITNKTLTKGSKPDSTHYDEGLIAGNIQAHPDKYAMMLSYYDMSQIFDFANKDGKIPDSAFIKAQCEPFSDEMEIDEEKLINWLDKFGINYIPCEPERLEGCTNSECSKLHTRLDRSHVSGHAARPELKEIIKRVAPKKLIPIHTENPEAFQKIIDEISEEGGPRIELILPEYGKSIEI